MNEYIAKPNIGYVNESEIERQQEEMKRNIILSMEHDTSVAITVDGGVETVTNDPDEVSTLLEDVWIRTVDFGEMCCDLLEINIDAYSK